MLAILLASCLVGAPQELAAGLRPRQWIPTKDLGRSTSRGAADRIIVKLVDDANARLVNGLVTSASAPGVAEFQAVLDSVDYLEVSRLIPLPDLELNRLRELAQQRVGRSLADMTQLFVLRTDPHLGATLVEDLLALDVVEDAYFAVPFTSASDGCEDTLYDADSLLPFKVDAPEGIEISSAELLEETGQNARLFIVERGWNLDHEDVCEFASQEPPVMLSDDGLPGGAFCVGTELEQMDHGMHTLGILFADIDADPAQGIPESGVAGICTGATGHLVSPFLDPPCTSFANPALTLCFIARKAVAGDLVLVELQLGDSYVPVEDSLAEFLAIEQLTALGVHVIEPAGNGAVSLSDPYVFFEKYDVNVRDSGAIMVSAAQRWLDNMFYPWWGHRKMPEVNRGSRIDCHVLGQNIVTLNDDAVTPVWPLRPETQPYRYNYTSAASAILAGMATLIESRHVALFDTSMPVWTLRALLSETGAPSRREPEDIGPDIKFVTNQIGREPHLPDLLNLLETAAAPGSPGLRPLHAFTGRLLRTFRVLPQHEDVVGAHFVGRWLGGGVDAISVEVAERRAGNTTRERARVANGRTGKFWRSDIHLPELGHRFRRVGDYNGDGVSDIADLHEDDGVLLLDGAGEYTSSTSPVALAGLSTGFGRRVESCAIGDFNGDGYQDIAAGVPAADTVFVDFGPDGPGWPDVELSVEWRSADFGSTVLSLPTSGAHDQLVIAAPNHDNGNGALYVHEVGPEPDQSVGSPLVVGATEAALGTCLVEVGDSRILIGAPGAAGGAPAGRVLLWTYNEVAGTWAQGHEWVGPSMTDRFGTSAYGFDDLDGDGVADVGIGAPGAAANSGAVLFYSGESPFHLVGELTGQSPDDEFGQGLQGGGDADGDGIDDIIVWARRFSYSYADPWESVVPPFDIGAWGRAYVFAGPSAAPAGPTGEPSLVASPPYVEAIAGGGTTEDSTLTLRAPAEFASKPYLFLISGLGAGSSFQVGSTTIPMTFDPSLTFAQYAAYSSLPGFLGLLDDEGEATAMFGTGAGASCASFNLGLELTVVAIAFDDPALLWDSPDNFASNPTKISFIDEIPSCP